MFGWFRGRARSPLDPLAKAWLEDRLQWLAGQFGRELFIESPVVLPTFEFFPNDFDGSEESIQTMLNRVCKTMRVSAQRVQLELFQNRDPLGLVNDRGKYLPSGAAGTFSKRSGRFLIRLDERQIDEPMDLVGTMAHELGHARLQGEKRIKPGCYDEELLTDLTAVFHGFGIFLASSPRSWESTNTLWPKTSCPKPEYMTLPMYGYALAHRSWHRGESRPEWLKHTRPEVRAVHKESLRYLTETGDSAFRPTSREA